MPDTARVAVDSPFAPEIAEDLAVLPVPGEPGLFAVAGVPFDAYGLARGDVVRVIAGAIAERVRAGGHRTVRVIFNPRALDDLDVRIVLGRLFALGVAHEVRDGTLYALDVPPDADYDEVRAELVAHHDAGGLVFEEAWRGRTDETQPEPDWLG